MASNQPGVVITGASTGIGRAAALRMAALGWRVFAGVRNDTAADDLRAANPALHPIRLDVTRPDSIDAARQQVQDLLGSEAGLGGLVNNAGIGVGGPLEALPVDYLRQQFEVNVFGQVAVTQAFLPLLRTGTGRIVNVSSIAGRVSVSFMGPYCASKHALEALSDALRQELAPWNIAVSVIEPGSIATPIWDKAAKGQETIAKVLDPRTRDLYGRQIEGVARRVAHAARNAAPVDRVSDAIEHALTARRPRTRYLVGRDARIGAALRWALPDRALDWLLARGDRR